MNTAQDTIVQLNKYPPDKYNVLVPVTSMQALSNMQRIIVNEVSLDTTVENGSGREIYYETDRKICNYVNRWRKAGCSGKYKHCTYRERPDGCMRKVH